MLQHLTPDLRHLVLAHLAVGEGDPGLGDPHLDAGGTAFDGFHPVVQIINLPAPAKLPPDGVGDDAVVVLEDIGLDGPAVLGCFLDDRHVPDAAPGHIQGAGDGGGGEGEDIDVGANSLIRSFCATPNRCSSSTMNRPRSVNFTSFESIR